MAMDQQCVPVRSSMALPMRNPYPIMNAAPISLNHPNQIPSALSAVESPLETKDKGAGTHTKATEYNAKKVPSPCSNDLDSMDDRQNGEDTKGYPRSSQRDVVHLQCKITHPRF